MRMNIFQHEFKMYSRSVITWSVSVAVLILVFVSLFSSFAQDAALLNEMMTKFPKELLAAFGMTGVNLATVLGFFSLAFLFVQICLAIQAANYGFSLVSVEEREWTADFLLAKPVGRAQILTSQLLAVLGGLLHGCHSERPLRLRSGQAQGAKNLGYARRTTWHKWRFFVAPLLRMTDPGDAHQELNSPVL